MFVILLTTSAGKQPTPRFAFPCHKVEGGAANSANSQTKSLEETCETCVLGSEIGERVSSICDNVGL